MVILQRSQLLHRSSGFNQRDFQLDFEIVANQYSAGFERGIPSESEFASLDLGGSGRSNPGIAVKSFSSAEGPSTSNNSLLATGTACQLKPGAQPFTHLADCLVHLGYTAGA